MVGISLTWRENWPIINSRHSRFCKKWNREALLICLFTYFLPFRHWCRAKVHPIPPHPAISLFESSQATWLLKQPVHGPHLFVSVACTLITTCLLIFLSLTLLMTLNFFSPHPAGFFTLLNLCLTPPCSSLSLALKLAIAPYPMLALNFA